jgi:GNAT superfamily N-acetyltransferase
MLQIRPMKAQDVENLCRFTDREIGEGYYTIPELREIYARSTQNGQVFSLILADDSDAILGARITYPPGQWEHGKGRGLTPERWPHAIGETAYFQSLFLARDLRGQGWGGRLSFEALKLLKLVGTKGVVCHSWKESPNNSSTKYLLKLGFVSVAEYPGYWSEVAYNCTRCLKPPCLCSAQEMYLDLEGKNEHFLLA